VKISKRELPLTIRRIRQMLWCLVVGHRWDISVCKPYYCILPGSVTKGKNYSTQYTTSCKRCGFTVRHN